MQAPASSLAHSIRTEEPAPDVRVPEADGAGFVVGAGGEVHLEEDAAGQDGGDGEEHVGESGRSFFSTGEADADQRVRGSLAFWK